MTWKELFRENEECVYLPLPLSLAILLSVAMTLGGHTNNKKDAVYLRFSDKPRAEGHILPAPSADQHRSLGRTSLLKGYDQDSFAFEAKQGKADPRVKFLSRGPSHAVYLTQDETVVVLPRLKGESPALNPASDAQSFAVLRMRFVGANRAPHVAGSARLPSAVTTAMRLFWQILYNAGADLVINGHGHNYERFAPQDSNGNLDLTKGLREFVVARAASLSRLSPRAYPIAKSGMAAPTEF